MRNAEGQALSGAQRAGQHVQGVRQLHGEFSSRCRRRIISQTSGSEPTPTAGTASNSAG